jgi:hypothetical protein
LHYAKILGGMWGFKPKKDRELGSKIFKKLLSKHIIYHYYRNTDSLVAYDQYFLKKYVYNEIKSRSVIHDSYTCAYFSDSTPFISKRKGLCYIGSIGYCDENKKFFECPIQCRPKEHLDWIYC